MLPPCEGNLRAMPHKSGEQQTWSAASSAASKSGELVRPDRCFFDLPLLSSRGRQSHFPHAETLSSPFCQRGAGQHRARSLVQGSPVVSPPVHATWYTVQYARAVSGILPGLLHVRRIAQVRASRLAKR